MEIYPDLLRYKYLVLMTANSCLRYKSQAHLFSQVWLSGNLVSLPGTSSLTFCFLFPAVHTHTDAAQHSLIPMCFPPFPEKLSTNPQFAFSSSHCLQLPIAHCHNSRKGFSFVFLLAVKESIYLTQQR